MEKFSAKRRAIYCSVYIYVCICKSRARLRLNGPYIRAPLTWAASLAYKRNPLAELLAHMYEYILILVTYLYKCTNRSQKKIGNSPRYIIPSLWHCRFLSLSLYLSRYIYPHLQQGESFDPPQGLRADRFKTIMVIGEPAARARRNTPTSARAAGTLH